MPADSPPSTLERAARIALSLGGAVWAVGLARTLALDVHVAFWYRAVGVLAAALIGGFGAQLVMRVLVRRGMRPEQLIAGSLALFLPLIGMPAGGHQPWRGPALLAGSLVALFAAWVRSSKRVWFALAVLTPLLVYLPDVSSYVGRADTFEFQVVGPQLGIAHPSGYPLYTLISKAFSLLPLEAVVPRATTAWRVNLSSSIFAALAAGALFLALTELRDGLSTYDPPLAFLSAQTLAFSPTLWSRAIEAEVYTLNAFLVAVGLWLAVRRRRGTLKPDVTWPAFGLLVGVAMASHLTLGALALLALSGLLVGGRRPGWRAWGAAGALGLLGLGLYAYIPLRWPAVNDGEMMSLAHFVRFVTNAESGGALRPLAFYQDPARWALVGRLFHAQIGWIGLLLTLIGVLWLGRRWPSLALGSGLAFAAWVWFNLSFYVADPDYSSFLIPAHVILIFWMGAGVLAIPHVRPNRRQMLASLIVPLIALVPLSRLWQTGPTLDTATQGRADELWARYALRRPLEAGAAILADSEKFPPLYYLQQVEAIRPDLEMVTLFNEAQYRAALEARLADGRAVYLARYLPGMDLYGVSSMGPLVAVGPTAVASPPGDAVDAAVPFGDALELENAELAPDPLGRPMHHLVLSWYTRRKPARDLEVRLRLVDAAGRTIWEENHGRPVRGYTTTEAWASGRRVQDYHPLAWPGWLPAGTYDLQVGLFARFSEEGLPVAGQSTFWHALGPVIVPDAAYRPLPRSLRFLVDGTAWIVGVRSPGEVVAGSSFGLDLAHVCRDLKANGLHPELHWLDAEGAPTTQQLLVPLGASAGDLCDPLTPSPVVRRYPVAAPEEVGRYRLALGWRDGNDDLLLTRCRWSGPVERACPVAMVTVVPATTGLANYDGRVLLLDAELTTDDVPAGGQLHLDLVWRAAQQMTKDYTVFVQVIGPDGKLYGQVDSQPVQGARPTSGWDEGEEIHDAYAFYVDTTGPEGVYRVILGWYLLEDMSRLPVVDASGRAVGDFYEVGSLTLP